MLAKDLRLLTLVVTATTLIGAALFAHLYTAAACLFALLPAAWLIILLTKNEGALKRLSQSRARLQLALEAASAGAFEIDMVKQTCWSSPQTDDLLGMRLTYERAAQGLWACIHPDDMEEATRDCASFLKAGAPLRCERRIVRPNGEVRWIRMFVLGELDNGRMRSITGLVVDIDERKRQELALIEAEQAALAASEAKSRFLAMVGHEIRTPMNGILGVLHLLKGRIRSQDGSQLLDEATACGEMLTALIDDVLDFSQIEAGEVELAPEPVDPAAVLDGVTRLLRPQCEAKGISLTYRAPSDLGWVLVDPQRLRQLLFNLVSNAVKFTDRGGVTVTLDHWPQIDGLRFDIVDTGVGVSTEARDGLFEQFQQGDGSMGRRFGGTGLGLSITRRLARLMGGDVGLSAARMGESGAAFWLTLAAPPAAAPVERTAAPSDAVADDLQILLVEDNPTNRLIATRILESLGMDVTTAENGEAGVAAARAMRFDLILMDIQMPGMDGLQATRQIRAMGGPAARTPIIALTANVLTHQRRGYLAAGMDGVIAKPISPALLLAEINRVVTGEPQMDEAKAS